uniref:CBF domain-containing protein n=1 Tax=Parastrongyloides trichosuri TaxID=131310 RepID=A0A0N4ZUS3_PARTI
MSKKKISKENESFEDLIRSGDVDKVKSNLQNLKIYTIDPTTNNATKSQDLDIFLNTIIGYIVTEKQIKAVNVLKKLAKKIFCYKDTYVLILIKLMKLESKALNNDQLWNIYNFIRSLPLPGKLSENLFVDDYNVMDECNLEKIEDLYQNSWMMLTKKKISGALAKKVLPFITDHRLEEFPKPELFGDFYFAYYNQGGVYAVLALSGLIKLVVKYNFEYPQFYQSVYKLTSSFILYASYASQFLDTLNLFLSSTHVPLYIVGAFVKKLARVCLNAPVCVIRPILTIIQNLITRYEGLRKMIHNDQCTSIDNDPYIESCTDLKECKALNSCLWEISALQRHWMPLVVKKANFIDKNIATIEIPYIFKTNIELFNILMNKKSGAKSENDDEDWSLKTKGIDKKFVSLKRKVIVEEDVSAKKIVKLEEPNGELLCDKFNFVISDIFVV